MDSKNKEVQDWSTLRAAQELWALLGLVTYYQLVSTVLLGESLLFGAWSL